MTRLGERTINIVASVLSSDEEEEESVSFRFLEDPVLAQEDMVENRLAGRERKTEREIEKERE